MQERESTVSRSYAVKNSPPIPFPAVCSFFEAAGAAIKLLAYDGQGFWLATKRLSKGRFRWWPTGDGPARVLRAHQAQLLIAAGNPEAEAAPDWRRVSA